MAAETPQGSPVQIELQMGLIKMGVAGYTLEELSGKLKSGLAAIQGNLDLIREVSSSLLAITPSVARPELPKVVVREAPPATIEPAVAEVLNLICKDAGVDEAGLTRIANISKPEGFDNYIPVLLHRPPEDEATLVIAYMLQVGFKKQQIDFEELKETLTKGNGYSLPRRTLGFILQKFEGARPPLVIRFKTKELYRPLCLSIDGLKKARELINAWCAQPAETV